MEKGKLERQVLLGYHSVYNEPLDLKSTLPKLPKNEAVKFIAYLLHLFNVRKRSDEMFQSNHLMQWMMKMGGSTQQGLLEFVTNNSSVVFDPGFKVLDRRPCLDLIQHLLVYADADCRRELGKDDFGTLFRLLLTFNFTSIADQEPIFNWDDTGSFQQFADEILKVQLRNIENEKFKDYVLQFLKVYYFFKFCETNDDYGGYLNLFLESLSLPSYKSYLWKLISPYLNLQVSDEPTPIMHFEGDEQFLSFYSRMAINDKATIDRDYKSLRTFPLFRLSEHKFLFLDFRFFVDKLYNGFLFDFSERVGLSFPKLKKGLGNHFSEPVLFYSIMHNCFEGYGNINLTGEQLKEKLKEAEPDYYIRHRNDIFLFEFKDILVSSDVKYADGIDKVKDGLLDKLEKDTKGKRKGITQLLNSIKQIKTGVYADREIDCSPADGASVFPIIVHTDISLEAYGVNYFLNQRMKELKQMDGVLTDGIQNLTMIHLDNLLLLQDHFKSGKLELGDCLKSYHKYISSGDPINDMISFDEFVKYYFVQNNKIKIGQPSIFKEIITDFQRARAV
ncbi:hypothetical protein [Mucilaginibacter sp.]